MSAYIDCPKCGEETLDVDTLTCDECGYGDEVSAGKLKGGNMSRRLEIMTAKKAGYEKTIISQFKAMCEESLPPEAFGMLEDVIIPKLECNRHLARSDVNEDIVPPKFDEVKGWI